jgi:DNA-binding MarR family transcriptional regulator
MPGILLVLAGLKPPSGAWALSSTTRKAGIPRSTAARSRQRLHEAGLVELTERSQNKRGTGLGLTLKGCEAVECSFIAARFGDLFSVAN